MEGHIVVVKPNGVEIGRLQKNELPYYDDLLNRMNQAVGADPEYGPMRVEGREYDVVYHRMIAEGLFQILIPNRMAYVEFLPLVSQAVVFMVEIDSEPSSVVTGQLSPDATEDSTSTDASLASVSSGGTGVSA